MSKIALLGDLHWGSRKDSPIFHEYFGKFFGDDFFPYLKKHNIKTVIQLGDLFDNRRSISPLTINESKKHFFTPMFEQGIECYAPLGNHDIFYRNSVTISSPVEFLHYPNLTIVENISTFFIENKEFCIVPWVCDENVSSIKQTLSKSKSDYCIGHFELNGHILQKGGNPIESDHALVTHDDLKHFDQVFSGHYHTQSKYGNVHYLGTPYENTWSDYDDQKGFWILDTDDGSLEFVPSTHTMFTKIDLTVGESFDELMIKDKYVKLIVDDTVDRSLIDSVSTMSPVDLKVIDKSVFDVVGTNDEVAEMDTFDAVKIVEYLVDQSTKDNEIFGKTMKKYLNELFKDVA